MAGTGRLRRRCGDVRALRPGAEGDEHGEADAVKDQGVAADQGPAVEMSRISSARSAIRAVTDTELPGGGVSSVQGGADPVTSAGCRVVRGLRRSTGRLD